MVLKYLFPVSKINYLVLEKMFIKYYANIGSVVVFGRSCHEKDTTQIYMDARFHIYSIFSPESMCMWVT